MPEPISTTTWAVISILANAALFAYVQITKDDIKVDQRPANAFESDSIPRARYGDPVPVCWGTVQFNSIVELASANKGSYPLILDIVNGPGGDQPVAHKYFLRIWYAICVGTINELRRIWFDRNFTGYDGIRDGGIAKRAGFIGSNVVHQRYPITYDDPNRFRYRTPPYYLNKPDLFGERDGGGGGIWGQIYFRPGEENRNSLYETHLNEIADMVSSETGITKEEASNNLPGHLDVSTILLTGDITHDGYRNVGPFKGFEISENQNMKQIGLEIVRIPNPLGLPAGGRIREPDGLFGCNPVTIIYEVLTEWWGLGLDESRIDVDSFKEVGRVMWYEKRGLNIILKNFTTAGRFINSIKEICNLVLLFDFETEKYVLKAIRTPPNINRLQTLTQNEVNRVIFSHNNIDENVAINEQRVTYIDRSLDYKSNVVLELSSADTVEGKPSSSADLVFDGISNSEHAGNLATEELNSKITPFLLCTIFFKPDVLVDLNIGDHFVLNFTLGRISIRNAIMTVGSINQGTSEDNTQSIVCTQSIFTTNYQLFHINEPTPRTVPIRSVEKIEEEDVLELPYFLTNRLIFQGGAFSINPEDSYIMFLASKGTQPLVSFDAQVSVDGGEYETNKTSAIFSSRGILTDTGNVGTVPTTKVISDNHYIVVSNINDISNLERVISQQLQNSGVGMMRIGNELIQYTAMDVFGLSAARFRGIRRAVLDTTRTDLSVGQEVWFLHDVSENATSAVNYAGTEMLSIRYLSRNSQLILDEADATIFTHTLQRRTQRAMPPHLLTPTITRSGTALTVRYTSTYKPRNSILYEYQTGLTAADDGSDRTIVNVYRGNTRLLSDFTILDTANKSFVVSGVSANQNIRYEFTRQKGMDQNTRSLYPYVINRTVS